MIEPGQPERSLLLRAIQYQDKSLKMPPGKALPAEIVADFDTWIRGGAPMPADAAPHAGVSRNFWESHSTLKLARTVFGLSYGGRMPVNPVRKRSPRPRR